MTSSSNLSYEFRIYIDSQTTPSDKTRRLKLLYETLSTYKLKGGIPIFWGGDESRLYMYEEDNPLQNSDLPANKTRNLNHSITCCMIQINENKNEEMVPFTITGLEWKDLIVYSKIVQPTDPYIMNIDVKNITNEDLDLEFGIAYACVYGPELTKTPKIVVVEDLQQLKCKNNIRKSDSVVYNSENSTGFKNFVKAIEIEALKKNGYKFYNGPPKW